jgi:site-specific recombinase XerD
LQAIAGDCPLRVLTPEHIDRYKTHRLGQVSPVSVNVELRALRSAMSTAMRWKLIDANPFANIRLVKTPDAVPSFLSKADFQKLLSVTREAWLRDIVTFAVLTGMRRSEIVNVRWRDIDLERRTVRIESKPDFVAKCGKVRTVPLNNVLVQFLQGKAGRSTSEYVFSLNGQRIAGDYVSHKFKSSIMDAGLSESLHFHSLRHTFATWLVQDGVSIYEVQKLLGHSSVVVTQIYSHLAASEMHETVNRIVLN